MSTRQCSKVVRLLIAILGLWLSPFSGTAAAQSYTIMPQPFGVVQDNSGHIVSGGCVWTYVAGTTTAATTYSDNAGTPNTNPIKADSAGRFTAYLVAGSSYKFVYENTPCTVSPPTHGPTLRTADNIGGVPAAAATVDITCTAGETISAGQAVYVSTGSGGKTPAQCYKGDSANAYSSSSATVFGIAPAAITSTTAGTVRIAGSVTGLSSLTPGTDYYIGSSGALTSSAPSNARKLGTADTATSIILSLPPLVPNADNGVDDFRLTLSTGVPVTTADVTAATTIYCTPGGKGNRIALYDSTGAATVYTSAEFSIAVPATTSTMYDVFAYANSGTPTLELTAWTNDTTRASAIVLTTTGVYTKTGDLTRRYLGSFRTTGTSGQTEDSLAKRYLWNYYNRVSRPMAVLEATDSWTYTTLTYRQANAATTNQLDFVIGVAEVEVNADVFATYGNSTGGVLVRVAIGEDSTSSPTTTGQIIHQDNAASGIYGLATAKLRRYPAVGRHTWVWLEESVATGTTTWYGDDGGSSLSRTQSGILGSLSGG